MVVTITTLVAYFPVMAILAIRQHGSFEPRVRAPNPESQVPNPKSPIPSVVPLLHSPDVHLV
jgi:hypothetical protein